ncbi:MAG: DUF4845 domain-containing protein [Tepidiphilus sp.]|jgi:hypothetical protein|uniref:DUF4845 domain-containing protein n=1 Tax=Tepidiphilus thermophilus TaxID=876478 RepID=A0A0K6IXT6_9PROT|nr:DUF4845 domain-containing protein [Tepidiphilus thermophilus]MBP6998768.1 DUF4845 domain-containing protein [Tepidiphilus sp.]MDK2797784.1 hypothetical protein [Tepidiphilus sp.]CUB07925.1 hypothetical protein Ga0061068_11439 [Tepidiphilus thermophilus]
MDTVMRRGQRGVSLLGVIFWGVIVGLGLILALRIVPVYTEYAAVKRAISELAQRAEPQTPPSQLRSEFDKFATIDDFTSVSGRDLVITREEGRTKIEVHYQRLVPLFANVSLAFDFEAHGTIGAP